MDFENGAILEEDLERVVGGLAPSQLDPRNDYVKSLLEHLIKGLDLTQVRFNPWQWR